MRTSRRRTRSGPRGRRAAGPAALLEHADPDGRPGDVGARHRDRQCRPSGYRQGYACQRGRRDLGRQRLSARGAGVAAAVRLVRRHFRIPPGLPLRSRPLYGGHVDQCDRGLAGDADPRPRPAGAWRRRADECQHRAGPLHLSAASARARYRHGLAYCLGVRGIGTEHRRGGPGCRVVAVAVRDQRADRDRDVDPGDAAAAVYEAERAPFRRAERGVVRADVPVPDRRHHRDRARPIGAAADGRIRRCDR